MIQNPSLPKVNKTYSMPPSAGVKKSRNRRIFLSWILALVFWLGLLGVFLLLPGPPQTKNLLLPAPSSVEPKTEKSLYMSFQEDELEEGPADAPVKVKKEPLKPKLKEPSKPFEKTSQGDETKTANQENAPVKSSSTLQDPKKLLMSEYIQGVVRKIEASKHYPLSARLQNQEGKIKLRFTLTATGELAGEPQILITSAYEALNQAALKAVMSAAPFTAFPAGASGPQDFILELQFTLKD